MLGLASDGKPGYVGGLGSKISPVVSCSSEGLRDPKKGNGMATSVNKRLKEKLRQERQRDKAQKRQERRAAAEARVVEPGVDPDLIGIVPGPQPVPEE